MLKKGSKHESTETRIEQILDASITCFSEHGFYATTMLQIANTCGLSKGSLYRYFKDKDAIIEAMFHQWETRFDHAIDEHTIKHIELTPVQKLDDLIYATSVFLHENKKILALWTELYSHTETMKMTKEFHLNKKTQVIHLVDASITQGYFRNDLISDDVALTILTLLEGLIAMGCINANLDIKKTAKTSWHMLKVGLQAN